MPPCSNPSPPAHSARSNRPEQPPILSNNENSSPDNIKAALSANTPAVHHPKNDSVLTQIDRILTDYSEPRQTAPSVRSTHHDHSPILINNARSSSDNTDAALSANAPAVHHLKKDSVLRQIDQVLTDYSTPRPTAPSARSTHHDHFPTLTNNARSSPDSTDVPLSINTAAVHSAKNDQVLTKIDQALPIYSTKKNSDSPYLDTNANLKADDDTHMTDVAPQHNTVQRTRTTNSPNSYHRGNIPHSGYTPNQTGLSSTETSSDSDFLLQDDDSEPTHDGPHGYNQPGTLPKDGYSHTATDNMDTNADLSTDQMIDLQPDGATSNESDTIDPPAPGDSTDTSFSLHNTTAPMTIPLSTL